MISPDEIINKTQCENNIPHYVQEMLNKLNTNYIPLNHNPTAKNNSQTNYPMLSTNNNPTILSTNNNHSMLGNTQNHSIQGNNPSIIGNVQNHSMLGNVQNHSILRNNPSMIGNSKNMLMSGNTQNMLMSGNAQNHAMFGNTQNSLLLGNVQNKLMSGNIGNSLENSLENKKVESEMKEEKMDEITKLLNDFIKNNNLTAEEEKDFHGELKKINSILPHDKKIVISFEKNKFKIQILDNKTERGEEQKILKKINQENIPEVTTYNFDTNIWYISLSSVVLTFLIIVMLLIKWKESS